jgi:hypothetical protein
LSVALQNFYPCPSPHHLRCPFSSPTEPCTIPHHISLHVFPSILIVLPSANLIVSLSPLSVSSCIRSSTWRARVVSPLDSPDTPRHVEHPGIFTHYMYHPPSSLGPGSASGIAPPLPHAGSRAGRRGRTARVASARGSCGGSAGGRRLGCGGRLGKWLANLVNRV